MFKKLILLFLLPAGIIVQAQDLHQRIKTAGTSKEFPADKSLTIFDSTRVKMEATGLSHVFMHQLYKILNKQGALEKRVFTIGYDPLSAYVEIKKVSIHKANGDVININPSTVKDYAAPARAIYWGAREKSIDIGRLEPGDAVEVFAYRKGFTYALLTTDDDDRYIPPMRGHFYDIVPFWSNEPILEKVYSVEVPTGKELQYEFYNGEIQSAVKKTPYGWKYLFAKKNILPQKAEPHMVSWSDVSPKLLLSTSPDWEAKSTWFYGVNEDFGSFKTTPDITKKTNEILKGATCEMDSIAQLTHWVADEIRYSGISMGPGEGFTLHSGEMNFADRCGVCKDKAGMLITMLRAAGFKSYAAMTMAGERIDRIPADQFNHSVTVVQKRNGEYMLLDPTWVPFNRELWSSLEQQQNYLIGLPQGADLMETPISAPENHFLKIAGQSKILENGTLEGEFTITGEGQSEAAVRGVFTHTARNDYENNLERELLRMAPQARIIEKRYTNPDEYASQPIIISIKYEIPNYAVVGKNEILFKPLLLSGIFRRAQPQLGINTSAETKLYPFRDRCSRIVEIDEFIDLPEGYTLATPVLPKKLMGDAATYQLQIKELDNKLKLSQKSVYTKRIYEANEWPNFREVVKAENSFINTALIFKK